MKTWKDLKEDEKDMLYFYYSMTLPNYIFYAILVAVVYIGAFIGVSLLMIPSIYTTIASFFVLFIALFLCLVTLRSLQRLRKRVKIIFDFNDPIEDFFGIKNSDLDKIKLKK